MIPAALVACDDLPRAAWRTSLSVCRASAAAAAPADGAGYSTRPQSRINGLMRGLARAWIPPSESQEIDSSYYAIELDGAPVRRRPPGIIQSINGSFGVAISDRPVRDSQAARIPA